MRISLPLNTLKLIVSRAAIVVLQVGFIKSYASVLTPKELGIYFYVSTVSYVLNALYFVPLDYHWQSNIAYGREKPLPLMLMLSETKIIVAMAMLTHLVIAAGLIHFALLSPAESIFAFLIALLTFTSISARNLLNNRDASLFVIQMLAVETILKISLFLLLADSFEPVLALLASTVAAIFIEMCLIVWFFKHKVAIDRHTVQQASKRSLFSFGLPISFSAFTNWLQLQGYRPAYVWLGHAETAGLFALIANVGQASMNAVSSVYAQIFLPRLVNTRGEFLKRYLAMAGLCILIAALSYFVIGDYIIALLTKPEYAPLFALAAIGVGIEGCNLLIGAMTMFISMKSATKTLYRSNALAVAAAMVALVFAFVHYPDEPLMIGLSILLSQCVSAGFLFFWGALPHMRVVKA